MDFLWNFFHLILPFSCPNPFLFLCFCFRSYLCLCLADMEFLLFLLCFLFTSTQLDDYHYMNNACNIALHFKPRRHYRWCSLPRGTKSIPRSSLTRKMVDSTGTTKSTSRIKRPRRCLAAYSYIPVEYACLDIIVKEIRIKTLEEHQEHLQSSSLLLLKSSMLIFDGNMNSFSAISVSRISRCFPRKESTILEEILFVIERLVTLTTHPIEAIPCASFVMSVIWMMKICIDILGRITTTVTSAIPWVSISFTTRMTTWGITLELIIFFVKKVHVEKRDSLQSLDQILTFSRIGQSITAQLEAKPKKRGSSTLTLLWDPEGLGLDLHHKFLHLFNTNHDSGGQLPWDRISWEP